MNLPIPSTIDEVTTDWLSQAMGVDVGDVSVAQIGAGIGVSSAVYRVSLSGGGPDSVVVKLPALAEEAVFTSTMLRMYIREVRFFKELATKSPIRVPASYYGDVDEETSQFVQVMEDMGDLRIVDQNEGMDLADAGQAVDELARWHATWWNDCDDLVKSGSIVALTDPIYPAVLPVVFAEGWEKLNAEMKLDPSILQVGPGWSARMPGLLASLNGGHNTMCHGDYRADNLLFDAEGNVVLLDFQLTGQGSGAYDLAYMITQSLAPDMAGEHEADLFERYMAGLIASGVPEAQTEDLWDRYREAALFCLAYPVIASRGMDLNDERQFQLIENMNTRFARAVDQLNLVDLM
ncbi:MAG: phosphotransferase [Acidimicrobiaceae bacterium]|jgi:hypothetical protein|nr:phosphotransferase [Acidimicrobiaceae bacterium]MBT5579461.1 phosphotransferase [Acidimicrobiaceae bacterium]